MNINVYKGTSANGSPSISRDIAAYRLSDTHITAMLTGGLLTKDITSQDIVTVVITDNQNGETISKVCKYISYNYQVVDTANSPNGTAVADNTLLFEILY